MPTPKASILCAIAAGICTPAALLTATAEGRSIVTANGSNSLTLTDLRSGNSVVYAVAEPTQAAIFSADGRSIFLAAGNKLTKWDMRTNQAVGSLTTAAPISKLSLSPSGRVLAAASGSSILQIKTSNTTASKQLSIGAASLAATSIAAISDSRTALTDSLGAARLANFSSGSVKLIKTKATNRAVSRGHNGETILFAASTDKSVKGKPSLTAFDAYGKELQFRMALSAGSGGTLSNVSQNGRIMVGPADNKPGKTSIVDVRKKRRFGSLSYSAPVVQATTYDSNRYLLITAGASQLYRGNVVPPHANKPFDLSPSNPISLSLLNIGVTQYGSQLNDRIKGERGNDSISTLAGNDRIDGWRGNDSLNSGEGDDQVLGGSGRDKISTEGGNDQIWGGDNSDLIYSGNDNDTIYGELGDDVIHAGSGNDSIFPGDNDDSVFAGDGDDRIIETGLGNDKMLDGGNGNDEIVSNQGRDAVQGGDGDDRIDLGNGNDQADGGNGNDLIYTGSGHDKVNGGAGDDNLTGDIGKNRFEGGSGNDQLTGNSGNDKLFGGEGDDLIVAGPGDDYVKADGGNDTIRVADEGTDKVDCGTGNDTVYVESTAPTRDSLKNCETIETVAPEPGTDKGRGYNLIMGTINDDTLIGTEAVDVMLGGAGKDTIYGQLGDDYVDGEDGDDTVFGGPGNDDVHGRKGNDVISGDDGNDRVNGAYGDDRVNGGPGNDLLIGSIGRDIMGGDDGDDRMESVDNEVDQVDCGNGNDVAVVDPIDVVAANCERVWR